MEASEEKESLALEELDQEAKCPVCLDLFEKPMVLACGHNFCCSCLDQLGAEASCPQCRAKVDPGSGHPNRVLANIVCLVKRIRPSGEGAQEENSSRQLCQEHRQPLQHFCSSEKSLLCPECLGGHQGHPLLSLPEAAQEYKGLLSAFLEPLKKEGQQLRQQRQAEEQNWQECQEHFAAEKQKVGLVFESLQGLLQERQPVWEGWLSEQEEKMKAGWGRALAQLSQEAFRLQQLFAQTERKCRQPDREFLQDIQDTVDRCEGYVVGCIESVSPRLRGRLGSVLEKTASVRATVDNYKASLQIILSKENLETPLATAPAPAPAPQKARSPKVYVTLDRSTAHPRLRCWDSGVTWAQTYQDLPDTPERFDQEFCVLGSEGFTTDWHCWEVSVNCSANASPVAGKVCWAIGVAKKSVRRKGRLSLCPQEGIFAVGMNNVGKMTAFSNSWQQLSWERPPTRLRVRLDWAGQVQLLDAETEVSLHTYNYTSFGEKVLPFFYVGQAGLSLHCEARPSK